MGIKVPAGKDGIHAPTAWKLAGCTRREADYWRRTGLVRPSVADSTGRGSAVLYDVRDVVAMRTVKALRAAGLPLPRVRRALREIARRWPEVDAPLSALVLVTDGRDLFRVLPEAEARDTLLSLVLRPGALAWRRVVLDVATLAREVREAVAREALAA